MLLREREIGWQHYSVSILGQLQHGSNISVRLTLVLSYEHIKTFLPNVRCCKSFLQLKWTTVDSPGCCRGSGRDWGLHIYGTDEAWYKMISDGQRNKTLICFPGENTEDIPSCQISVLKFTKEYCPDFNVLKHLKCIVVTIYVKLLLMCFLFLPDSSSKLL